VAKLTDRQKNNILAKWNTGSYTKTQLAKTYKVSEKIIRNLVGNTKTKKGNIYIIQAGNLDIYKIGVTKNISERLKQLQTASFLELNVIKIRETSKYDSIERYLHKTLKEWNIRGEWFKLSNDMIIVIKKLIDEV